MIMAIYIPTSSIGFFSPGYPLLTAKIVNVTGTGVEVIRVYQKRFVYPTNDMKDDDAKWAIPFNFVSPTNNNSIGKTEGYYIPDNEYYFFGASGRWLMFNTQTIYFYRVNYDEIMWNRLIYSLKHKDQISTIDVLSRAQLVDDIFNIARTGDVRYQLAFDLIDYLQYETEYYPWYSAFNVFSYILGKTGDVETEDNLKAYILYLLNHTIAIPDSREYADEETHIGVLKNVMILNWALDDYNVRGIVFCTGIRYSDEVSEDWEFLWNIYTSSLSVQEQEDVLNALGCTEDEDLLKLYLLKIITTNSGLKKQDMLTAFKSVVSSAVGILAATSFLDNNITEVVALGTNLWPEIVNVLAEELFTDEQLDWSKARTYTLVNNYWANNYQVYVKEILFNLKTSTSAPTTVTTSTDSTISTTSFSTSDISTSSLPVSTTDVSSTTTGSSPKRKVPTITGAILIVLVTLIVI
ncbi:hypothetical protein NQ317_015852 [Molorchus minor]|uniref:ERAP1-like C-terminal domain-containing protein n=1 Tax=Molorchus minor TaxID=1323400 RepID=A0ABQ9J7T0_9CUCU|nr:hypothetical protein NQ317_015852 [Molorchus minor]